MSPAPSSSVPVSSTQQQWCRPAEHFADLLQVGTKRVRNVGAGSGSDVEGGAASGGEMSESGKSKKLKLNPPAASSQNGTPQGSRTGSPAPLASKGVTGSRASSPEGGTAVKGKFHLVLQL